MLVLTRRAGQAVYLGSNIKVTMVKVRGGEVRLAIEAPRSVPVLRDELDPRRRVGIDSVAAGSGRPEPSLVAPKSSPHRVGEGS
ncbi:carbon storage regulator [bacterium]|nr:carbon storage regulator [bacterium]